MAHSAESPRSRRLAVLAAVVGGHVVAIALVLASRSSLPAPSPKPHAISLMAVDTTLSPPIAAVPPTMPSKLRVDQPVPEPRPASKSSESVSDVAAECTALDTVAKAIMGDPTVLASIHHAPMETRSIADAIVIWNAQWSEAAIAADAPLEPVRLSVQATLSAVDEGCLDQAIAGPRLVPIPNGEGTTFLVFGSGSWSLRQLLAETEPARAAIDARGKAAPRSVPRT